MNATGISSPLAVITFSLGLVVVILRFGKRDFRPDAVVEQPESMSEVVVLWRFVHVCAALIACA